MAEEGSCIGCGGWFLAWSSIIRFLSFSLTTFKRVFEVGLQVGGYWISPDEKRFVLSKSSSADVVTQRLQDRILSGTEGHDGCLEVRLGETREDGH